MKTHNDPEPPGPLVRGVVLFAEGFGLGRAPFASGTVGSLWGILLVLAAWPWLDWPGQLLLAAGCAVLAYPVCEIAERHLDRKDDPRIVADEFLTFPLCMIGLPLSWTHWWVLPMAFVTCRVCDIVKPPPAFQAQRLKGGLGIATDDVVASLYSLGINHLLFALASLLLS